MFEELFVNLYRSILLSLCFRRCIFIKESKTVVGNPLLLSDLGQTDGEASTYGLYHFHMCVSLPSHCSCWAAWCSGPAVCADQTQLDSSAHTTAKQSLVILGGRCPIALILPPSKSSKISLYGPSAIQLSAKITTAGVIFLLCHLLSSHHIWEGKARAADPAAWVLAWWVFPVEEQQWQSDWLQPCRCLQFQPLKIHMQTQSQSDSWAAHWRFIVFFTLLRNG